MIAPIPRSPLVLAPLAALLLGGGVALAQGVALDGPIEIPEDSDAYVAANGEAVRTGLGDCLRLGGFSVENQVDACEGIEEVAEAPAPAPEPTPAPPPEPVEAEPIVTTATLGGEALFDTDSAELIAASEQALADLLVQLENYQEISDIEVVGHTDSRGAEAYNQQLSERRAQSVQAFLQAAYPDIDITARGEGETNPVATNTTPEGRQLNRRVEIQVTAKSVTDA